MDIATASGRLKVRGFSADTDELDLLTVGDLGALQGEVPGEDRRFVTVFQLVQWAKTPAGADAVLRLALAKRRPGLTLEDVRRMGSVMQRVQLAQALMVESLLNGEEAGPDDGGNAPKAPAPGIG